MITSRSVKWLYREFEAERNKALEDSSNVPTTGEYSLDDLGVTTTQGGGINNPETYLIDSNPVDPNTTPKTNKISIINIQEGEG